MGTLQVAPGMEVCYVVIFEPQEVRAYSAELMVVTEREKFIVPVGAVGHRAVLDFPDQVCGFCLIKTQPSSPGPGPLLTTGKYLKQTR